MDDTRPASAVLGLVEPAAWRSLAAIDRVEVTIAGVTAAGVVVVGVLQAVAFAVALTIVDAVRRSAHPGDAVLGYDDALGRWADVTEHPHARIEPGIVVYRLESRLFFANASYVRDRIEAAVRGAATPTELGRARLRGDQPRGLDGSRDDHRPQGAAARRGGHARVGSRARLCAEACGPVARRRRSARNTSIQRSARRWQRA